ncbi:hypothetical protein, conserved [Plasmodium vivax]|uniref:Uncharacterized protein n=2 Tax=Plasmodium vivax TaxID=5855 RepID=A5K7F3_PLAVS|nr:hypothetical protein, conserved [Plasmodium vivax]EDL44712.1 hypothetical protein, conserved [Plasmodium vivax]KMZ86990.1 hypothetical protein PVBG_02831 [Plasmodium vivax Brazil I]|eukprot:XP_001614439.1 hypothetical protein [Plasmodium vivax Sal-1]
MKISPIRKKVNSSLVVSKRIPSYLKKEKINLSKNNGSFDKKSVKYNQVPQFVQAIIKFTKKNKLLQEEENSVVSKNKLIFLNNLLSEIQKNKTILTSSSIHDIYRCLYKLNYLKIDVICTLFSVLINNAINFSKISGYVHCDFKELINITKFLHHFRNICNSNIQAIIHDSHDSVNLRIVKRYLKEHGGRSGPSVGGTYNSGVIYTHVYSYIAKYDRVENVDILLYSLLKGKRTNVAVKGGSYGEEAAQQGNRFTLTDAEEAAQQGKHFNLSDAEETAQQENHFALANAEEAKRTLLVEHINSFYKLNDMFAFLLNKVLTFFNERAESFNLYHLKLLFFFLGKFQTFDAHLMEKLTNRIIEEIERIKTNPKLLHDDTSTEERKKHNYAKNRIKKLRKKYVNTFVKIDSKEFLTLPYTIGLSMNTYFNNYLIEYVNMYVLSLINSRVNCDMVSFAYCLVGYKHIMVHFFILFNIFLFKEKCMKNKKLLEKYGVFLRRLGGTHSMGISEERKNPLRSSTIEQDGPTQSILSKEPKMTNCAAPIKMRKNPNEENNCVANFTCMQEDHTDERDKMGGYKNPEEIFNMLLGEFQMKVENIFLINLDKHSIEQSYNSEQLRRFYLQYKKLFEKVFNYAIFLLSKYEPEEMLRIYKNLKAHALNDQVVKQLYVEVLYEKVVFNSGNEKKVSSLLRCVCGE